MEANHHYDDSLVVSHSERRPGMNAVNGHEDFDGAPLMFKRESTRMPYKPNPRLPISKEYRFDGQGGYAPNSGKIPFVDALLFVGGTALTIWATVRISLWIWG